MIIKWHLHTEDTLSGKIEPDDLCGKISITYKDASINDDLVYLENWFDGFVYVCDKLYLTVEGEYDLITEPDPLRFKINNGFLDLSYKNSHVYKIPVKDFRQDVIDSGKSLVGILMQESKAEDLSSLGKLIDFLKANSA